MENVTAFTSLLMTSATSLIENFTDLSNISTSAIDITSVSGFLSPAPTEGPSSTIQEATSIEATTFTPSEAVSAVSVEPTHYVVPFWDSPLSHGINVIVGFVLCFTMLGLGCTVELSQIGEHIRRPIGVLLALISQFVIMPLVAFFMALIFALDGVAAVAVLLCGCCPGGNLSNIMSVLVNGEMNLSIIMTTSSTVLALLLMPLCLWIYSRPWIDTPLVQLLPFGAVTLTLCSTLIPIGLGVLIRYKYTRVADIILKVSLWSLFVTLVILFILTGTMLGPQLLATIPATVYVVAVLMPLAGYALGYGLATLFKLPPNCRRTVSLETGCQNVQLCTALLKLTFPPQHVNGMYMFPLLYALFQAAEAGLYILVYRIYRKEALHKVEPLPEDDDSDISYKKLKEEEVMDTDYGTVNMNEPNYFAMEPTKTS